LSGPHREGEPAAAVFTGFDRDGAAVAIEDPLTDGEPDSHARVQGGPDGIRTRDLRLDRAA
jgi:hypothetical protein